MNDEISIGSVLGVSARAALPVMRTYRVQLAIALLLTAFLTGSLFRFAPQAAQNPNVMPPWLTGLGAVTYLAWLVVGFYGLAAAVRTVEPAFGMTVGRFFGYLGYTILAGLLSALAMLVFFIPVLWVWPKIVLAPYAYLLYGRSAQDPIARVWNATTGRYWHTLGLFVVIALIICAFEIVIYAIGFVLALLHAPVALGIYSLFAAAAFWWLIEFITIAYVHWIARLVANPHVPQDTMVPAAR